MDGSSEQGGTGAGASAVSHSRANANQVLNLPPHQRRGPGLSSTPLAGTAPAPASAACAYMEVGSRSWQAAALTDLSLCQVKTRGGLSETK